MPPKTTELLSLGLPVFSVCIYAVLCNISFSHLLHNNLIYHHRLKPIQITQLFVHICVNLAVWFRWWLSAWWLTIYDLNKLIQEILFKHIVCHVMLYHWCLVRTQLAGNGILYIVLPDNTRMKIHWHFFWWSGISVINSQLSICCIWYLWSWFRWWPLVELAQSHYPNHVNTSLVSKIKWNSSWHAQEFIIKLAHASPNSWAPGMVANFEFESPSHGNGFS